MTRFDASEPAQRRALLAEAIAAHRRRGSDAAVFVAGDDRVRFADRTITLSVDDAGRERLDALLEEFPVFKIEQPATRKAEAGTVHVAAIADPKHAADFLDRAFAEVFDRGEGYTVWVTAV